jgi:hypothetical protein
MSGKAPRRRVVAKGLILLFALIDGPARIWGQSDTTATQPNEHVTFAGLAGSVIEASVVRDQIVRREGKTFPVRVQNEIKILIGPDDRIQQSITPTADTRRGRRVGATMTAPFLLGKSRSLYGVGGGEGVVQFEDGVLSFLRTFKRGALKRTIAFSRSPNGLCCTAEETFAREEGVGDLAMNSAIDGTPVTIISYKQISSTRRVVKEGETPNAGDRPTGAVPNEK